MSPGAPHPCPLPRGEGAIRPLLITKEVLWSYTRAGRPAASRSSITAERSATMAEHDDRVQSRPIAHGGAVLRGLDRVSRADAFAFEGRFGRLFPDLPPLASSDRDLARLAGVML